MHLTSGRASGSVPRRAVRVARLGHDSSPPERVATIGRRGAGRFPVRSGTGCRGRGSAAPRASGGAGTIRGVQQVELALITSGALAILVAVAVRFRSQLRSRPVVLGSLLGIVPGILGATIVLVPRTDLVPDDAEPWIWLLIAILTSVVALAALSRGLFSR